MSEQRTKVVYWRLCSIAVAVLSVLTFTPLVTPPGRYEPMLGGVPLTLWAGIELDQVVRMTITLEEAVPGMSPEQASSGQVVLRVDFPRG